MQTSVCVFLFLASFWLSHETQAHPVVLFQFGDSLSDTGNALQGLGETGAASPPYGVTYFGHPTGRVCDGRLIIDFIATQMGVPLLVPYLNRKGANTTHGVNFATNGATALGYRFYLDHNMTKGLGNTLPLDAQLGFFLGYQQSSQYNGVVPPGGIYIVGEIGGNDYKTMIYNKLNTSQIHSLVPIVVESIERHILELYKAGGRKFVVVNIPLQGCNPRWTATASSHEVDKLGCLVWLNDVNRYHNKLLKSKAQRLKNELKGVSISYGDFERVLTEVLENPSVYGFSNPHIACCGIYTKKQTLKCSAEAYCGHPQKSIYWNDNHFTEHFYKIVAQHFLSRNSSFIDPPIDW